MPLPYCSLFIGALRVQGEPDDISLLTLPDSLSLHATRLVSCQPVPYGGVALQSPFESFSTANKDNAPVAVDKTFGNGLARQRPAASGSPRPVNRPGRNRRTPLSHCHSRSASPQNKSAARLVVEGCLLAELFQYIYIHYSVRCGACLMLNYST